MRSRISSVVSHADVGGDQRVFQLVQQVGVDLLLALQRVFQRVTRPARVFCTPLFSFSRRVGSCSTEPNRV